MNDYVERLCPVEMPEAWTWVSLIEEFKAKERERRIREALANAPRSLVRFAPEKGKLDCRLKRMNEREPKKLTEADVKRAAQILDKAWSEPYITLDEIMASLLAETNIERAAKLLKEAGSGPPFTSGVFLDTLLEDEYYRIPEGGAEYE